MLMVHANLDGSTEAYSYERLDRARFEALYRGCAKLPAGWYPLTGDRSCCLSPQEALTLGLIDSIDASARTRGQSTAGDRRPSPAS